MSGADREPGLGYQPAVDGLRAVAVTAVILFHLWPAALRGGFTGVDIFFVISGFVVTGSVIGRRFATLREMLGWFYARRLMRIMPALVAMLLVTILAAQLFIPDSWLSNTLPQVARFAFFGLSNIVLAVDTDTYFGPQAGFNPFTHTWSLGVEEQFYLIFPLLLFWHLRQREGRDPMPRARVVQIVAGATLLSLVLCGVIAAWANQRYAFYLIPARFWELGLGMLLCLTIEHWRPALAEAKAQRRVELALLSLLLLAGGMMLHETLAFPFPYALLPVLGSAGLIMSVVASTASPLARALGWKPVVAAGLLSYSLYLWHWPVFVLFRWTMGLDTLPLQLLALGIAVALSLLSYFLIERPLRSGRRIRALPRGRVVAGAAGGTLIAAVLGFTMIALHDRITLSVTRDHAAWYADEEHPNDPAISRCGVKMSRALGGATNLYLWQPVDCTGPQAGFTVHAIGDSHAIAYTPVYRQLAGELGMRARAWARPRCPFLKLIEPTSPFCIQVFGEMVYDLKANAKPGDVIFLPGLRQTRFINQYGFEHWADNHGPDNDVDPETLRQAVLWLKELRKTGAPIILEAPKPLFRAPTFRCSDWFNRINPVCAGGLTIPRAELERRRAPAMAALQELARQVPGVTVWDPFPILCPGETCSAAPDGQPLFMDGDHLSGHGNMVLYASLRAEILRAAGREVSPLPGAPIR